jgi:hypothetical protein
MSISREAALVGVPDPTAKYRREIAKIVEKRKQELSERAKNGDRQALMGLVLSVRQSMLLGNEVQAGRLMSIVTAIVGSPPKPSAEPEPDDPPANDSPGSGKDPDRHTIGDDLEGTGGELKPGDTPDASEGDKPTDAPEGASGSAGDTHPGWTFYGTQTARGDDGTKYTFSWYERPDGVQVTVETTERTDGSTEKTVTCSKDGEEVDCDSGTDESDGNELPTDDQVTCDSANCVGS